MAHPYDKFRQSKVEHSRAQKYADGGQVSAPLSDEQKSAMNRLGSASSNDKQGGPVSPDADSMMNRMGRASGGRTNKSKGTNVNVIITGHGANPAPMAAGAGATPVPPPMPAPRPPMPMGGPPLPPGGPGPQPPRSQGGRAYASGGAVKAESLRLGTKVEHHPNKSDAKDVGKRGKPITYATGGAVEAPKGKAGMSPHMPGGARGGEARLAKERRAAKTYAKPK